MNTDTKSFQEKELDLGQIYRLIIMQSKLIIVIVFLSLISSVSYYLFSEKTFRINSMIQIFSSNDLPSGLKNNSFDIVLGSSNFSDINNITGLYKTRKNIFKIIEELNLDINFIDLEREEVINLTNFDYPILKENQTKIFYFGNKGKSYEIFDKDKSLIGSQIYGRQFLDGALKINIDYSNIEEGKLIKFVVRHRENLYRSFKRLIQVKSINPSSAFFSKDSGLIEVSLISKDIEKGKKLLNSGNRIFLEDNIEIESEKARKAIQFIEQRINNVKESLDVDKKKLKDFQEKNKSVNVDLEIETIINSTTEIEKKINSLDIEIAAAEKNYTKTNPVYIDLLNQKRILNLQKDNIENRIIDLPLAQQEYIDLFKNVEISQEIYSELLNRQLSYSIIEASTLGNLRIVDDAYVDLKVSPKSSFILYTFIFSLFASVLLAIIRGLFFLPITNPAELEDNNINLKISGVIPYMDGDKTDGEDDIRFSQSIESLTLNIKNSVISEENSCKVILITSPSPSNGKSFVSINLAKKLASLGDRVCLLDSDLKKGVIHKRLNLPPLEEKRFNQIREENLGDFKVEENFYVIPKVRKLVNSFNFIYSEIFNEKFSTLKQNFDFIIIDTAPLLSVSDTSILLGKADLRLNVIRHGVNKIKEVKQFISICDQVNQSVDGIIYNGYEKPKGYYGYYALYGNYSYQYYAKKYLYTDYYYSENDENEDK